MAQVGVLEVKVVPDLTGFGANVSAHMQRVSRDVGKTLAGVGKGVKVDTSGVDRAASTIRQRLGQAVDGVNERLSDLGLGFVTVGRAAGAGALAAGAAFVRMGITTASSLETAQLQFETLLGSTAEAKERVQELFQFAKTTPFAADEVIKASRVMQTFGGDVLATSENLTLVGDAAAATGGSFEEVAFWVARAYSMIESGRPFGEAALRLQELGVLSGDARTEMEGLAASGASADEIFGVFQEELGGFAGAMERQQASWKGLTSTLQDVASLAAADILAPLFESLKNLADAALGFAESDAFGYIGDGLRGITTAGVAPLNLLADALGLVADNADIAIPAIGGLVAAFAAMKVASFVRDLGGISGALTIAKVAASEFATGVQSSIAGATGALGGIGAALGALGAGLIVAGGITLLTQHLQQQAEEARKNTEQINSLASAYADAGPKAETLAEFLRDQAASMREAGEDEGDQLTLLRDLAGGWDNLSAALEGNENARARLAEAVANYAHTESGAAEELATARANLTDETDREIEARVRMSEAGARERGIISDLTSVTESWTGKAREAQEQTEADTTARDRNAAAATAQADAIDTLRLEFERLYAGQLSVAEQQVRLAEGTDQVAAALAVSNDLMSLNTEESRASAGAVQGQVQSIYDYVSALVASGTSATEARAAGQQLTDQLVGTMTQFGLTEDEARAYLATLGLTPESVATLVELEDQQAQQDIASVQGGLDAIDATNPTPDVTANDHGSIAALDYALDQAARERTAIIRIQPTGYALLDAALAPLMSLQSRAQGEPMMGPTEDPAAAVAMSVSPLAAATDTMTLTLRPRVYATEVVEVADARQPMTPVIENRVYVGNEQITDIVRQEARIIERDRSMRYITGVPSGVTL